VASDLGPIPRQVLTRAEDFFDDLLSLTLSDELARGQAPKRTVGTTGIGTPASSCRKAVAICSSENRLFFIARPPG
jgi:hypothetical protein